MSALRAKQLHRPFLLLRLRLHLLPRSLLRSTLDADCRRRVLRRRRAAADADAHPHRSWLRRGPARPRGILLAQTGNGGKGPSKSEGNVNYTDTMLYTEAATGRVGAFFEMSYMSLDPENNPHAAGFGDMMVGTKTLLLDCELLQVGIEFKTYLPVGDASKGLGTGHVSLEPSLLAGLRISECSALQGQLSEWIPIGGDPNYEGAILHYHLSWNNLLYQFHPQVPLISTMEFNGWSFQTGSYTLPDGAAYQKAGDSSYFSAGPGLRLFVCDKLDFGCGVSFALTQEHWAATLFRSELRLRF